VKYYRTFGFYGNKWYEGPDDPKYTHDLLINNVQHWENDHERRPPYDGGAAEADEARAKRKERIAIEEKDKKVRTRVLITVRPDVSSNVHPNPSVTSSVPRDVMMTSHQEHVTSEWQVPSIEELEGEDDDDSLPELLVREDASTVSEEDRDDVDWKEPTIYARNDVCPLEEIYGQNDLSPLEEWADQYFDWLKNNEEKVHEEAVDNAEAFENRKENDEDKVERAKEYESRVKQTVKSKVNELICYSNVSVETANPGLGKWDHGPHTFLADSGASSHMGHCDAGMFDFTTKSCGVKVGDGKTLTVSKIGKKAGILTHLDGTKMNIVLENYKHVPGLWVNLFSVTQAMSSGWNLKSDGRVIMLIKGADVITV